jgi:hypothetical protein
MSSGNVPLVCLPVLFMAYNCNRKSIFFRKQRTLSLTRSGNPEETNQYNTTFNPAPSCRWASVRSRTARNNLCLFDPTENQRQRIQQAPWPSTGRRNFPASIWRARATSVFKQADLTAWLFSRCPVFPTASRPPTAKALL